MSSPLRNFALKIHLYLGLTAGMVIAICCLTGAALVFEPEITRALHPDWYHIEGTGTAPIAQALAAVQATAPRQRIQSAAFSNDPDQPWEFLAGDTGRVLVDPHTARVITIAPFRIAFFQKAMELHRWLLTDGGVGEWITGAATLMFVFLLLMGLIIWWPRTKGAFKARINPFAVFSKHGGGRRKLHDLHVALGIWCWPFLFVIALTAMPLAYDWAGNLVSAVTGAKRPPPPPKSGGDSGAATLPLDTLVAIAHATFPEARMLSVRLPQRTGSAVSIVQVQAGDPSDRHTDVAYVDRLTGAVLRTDRWTDLNAGMKIRRMNEWWHTGRAWGIPLRVLWFLAVLLGASFPVTGFLMYRAGKKTS